MNIFAHSFNPASNSGPNKFTRQLFNVLNSHYDTNLVRDQQMADVEFCLIQQQFHKVKPMVLRLDGIWFNSDQDYNEQNKPIKYSYDNADAVVFQSEFNKRLTEQWFGYHDNSWVIHNAADLDLINKIPAWEDESILKYSELWVCASNWRPHKRLKENIRYFLEFAPKDAGMMIAGKVDDFTIFSEFNDNRLMYCGELNWTSLIALCKKATTFIHLAYLDHCPNVVVDAQAAGCKVVCSSTGGTPEIIENGIIVHEEAWDFKPCRLYEPPVLKFNNIVEVTDPKDRNIVNCSERYYNIFKGIL